MSALLCLTRSFTTALCLGLDVVLVCLQASPEMLAEEVRHLHDMLAPLVQSAQVRQGSRGPACQPFNVVRNPIYSFLMLEDLGKPDSNCQPLTRAHGCLVR
jgi:hypothetical protein